MEAPQRRYDTYEAQVSYELGWWQQLAKSQEHEIQRLRIEVALWKDRYRAIEEGFDKAMDAPCYHCGMKP